MVGFGARNDSFRHPDTALTSSPFKLLTHSIRLSFYEDNLEPKTKKQVLSYNMFFSCLWLSEKSLISICHRYIVYDYLIPKFETNFDKK